MGEIIILFLNVLKQQISFIYQAGCFQRTLNKQ